MAAASISAPLQRIASPISYLREFPDSLSRNCHDSHAFSELQMRPKRRHHHRPAIAVVTWIIDVLHSGSDIDSAPNVCGVKRFDDVLSPVIEFSVAEEETEPAVRQVDLMIFLDPVCHEGRAGTILLAM